MLEKVEKEIDSLEKKKSSNEIDEQELKEEIQIFRNTLERLVLRIEFKYNLLNRLNNLEANL